MEGIKIYFPWVSIYYHLPCLLMALKLGHVNSLLANNFKHDQRVMLGGLWTKIHKRWLKMFHFHLLISWKVKDLGCIVNNSACSLYRILLATFAIAKFQDDNIFNVIFFLNNSASWEHVNAFWEQGKLSIIAMGISNI